MSHEELSQFMVDTYAREFTADELAEMTEFYETDLGRKTIRKMPVIMQRANEWAMKKVRANQSELREIMRKAQ